MASISPVSSGMAVSLRGVTKHYGALHAVDGVDLDIARGEIFGLIGHNGAGKSTLFKMMLGLIPATSGEILVGGASVRGRCWARPRCCFWTNPPAAWTRKPFGIFTPRCAACRPKA